MKTQILTVHQKINYRSWFHSSTDWFFILSRRAYNSFGYSDNECFTSINAPYFTAGQTGNSLYHSELGKKLKS